MPNQFNNAGLAGQTIGCWQVLDATDKRRFGMVVYKCKCTHCGQLVELVSSLIRKKVTACECQGPRMRTGSGYPTWQLLLAAKPGPEGNELFERFFARCEQIGWSPQTIRIAMDELTRRPSLYNKYIERLVQEQNYITRTCSLR